MNILLTEKSKAFIESVASRIQDFVELKQQNKYDYSRFMSFLISLGAKFHKDVRDYTTGDTIHLTFLENNIEDLKAIEEKQYHFSKDQALKLFHESWHFLKYQLLTPNKASNAFEKKLVSENSFTEYSNVNEENEANYFSRAMYIPEREFRKDVVENVDSDGYCDIYRIASEYDLSYSEVINRGNELNIWKK